MGLTKNGCYVKAANMGKTCPQAALPRLIGCSVFYSSRCLAKTPSSKIFADELKITMDCNNF